LLFRRNNVQKSFFKVFLGPVLALAAVSAQALDADGGAKSELSAAQIGDGREYSTILDTGANGGRSSNAGARESD